METILKPHNTIELPHRVCCKLNLMPGARFEVEVDEKTGKIIFTPIDRHGSHPRPRKVKIPPARVETFR